MARTLRLSVLDQAPVATGSSPSEALQRSVELARRVEALGYSRFWMSEHHAMATLACTAPEIMLARIGAVTSTIRLGSGGIMLPHYAPFKVAEVFRTLHALYPNRIDLGIGRAPGGGPIENLALRRERRVQAVDDFPDQLSELLAFLGYGHFAASHPFAAVRVSPESPGAPRPWLLGSSLWGATAAAAYGLPYAFAHFFSPVATRSAIATYRSQFQPSAVAQDPECSIAIGVICADTTEEAHFLLNSVLLLQQRIRQGDRKPVEEAGEALRLLQQSAWPAIEEGEWPRYVVGTPENVRDRLMSIADQLDLNELLVNTICWSHTARLHSYDLLAKAFQLTGAA